VQQRIGDYRVLEELGRGGMGAVFRAFDEGAQREVAVKLLLGAAAFGKDRRRRFEREAELLARLRHPGVVPVHACGEHQGTPFLVLGLVEGESLQEALDREGPLPSRSVAVLGEALAASLSHCHEQGVIHRDLKPENVLLDPSGRPLLTDFGLAKDTSLERSKLSVSGAFLGTPGYWAPEQARGDSSAAGPPIDVYGLGAVLYASLTGRPPVEAASVLQALTAAIDQVPLNPSALNPSADPDLAAICMRCLEKAPADRYPSAAAVREDLRRWLVGESPAALRRRRRRGGAWLAAGGLLGLGLAAGWLVHHHATRADRAFAASADAWGAGEFDRAEALLTRVLELEPERVEAWVERGRHRLDLGRHEEAMADADQALALDDTSAQAWVLRGRGLAREKMPGALQALNRALTLDPTLTEVRAQRSFFREKGGDLPGALEDLDLVIEQAPLAIYYERRGRVHEALGDLEAAVADWERAVDDLEYPQAVLVKLGLGLASVGRKADAERVLTRAVSYSPKSISAWMKRAELREARGELPGAIEDCGKALAINPRYWFAHFRRAQMHQAREAWAEALSDYDAAIRLHVQPQPQLYFLRAQVRFQLGKPAPGTEGGSEEDLRGALED
jgi:tetratricopeptide (TPR) repeat protein/predicted Ser/Thr protein kinase